jgi:hypothetical protein
MYKRKLTRREVPKIPLISNRTDIPSCLNQKLSLYRQANALIHCSNGDKKFFEQKLPLILHQLVIPCLNPRHEKALTQIRGHAYGSHFDFVYVGNNNFANFIAVKWLLTEVFPLLNEPPPRIAFVGCIKELVRQMDQRLHEKYKHYFVGSVPDIAIYYSASTAVLAPSLVGTGCSLKFTLRLSVRGRQLSLPRTHLEAFLIT